MLREALGGAVLLLGMLGGLSLGIVSAFDPGWMEPHSTFTVMLDQGFGVRAGLPVTIAGREVGYVDSVELGDDRNVRLVFRVEERYAQHVHEDSSVQVLQLLSGKYVEVRAGRGGPLADGGELFFGTNFDPLITLSDLDLPATLKQVSDVLTTVVRLVEAMDLDNPDLVNSVASVSRLLSQVEQGEGTVGRLFADDAPVDEGMALLRRLDTLVTEAESLVDKVDGAATSVQTAGDGLVGVTGKIGEAAGSLERTSGTIDRTLQPVPATLQSLDLALKEMAVTLEALQRMPGVRRGMDKGEE